MAWTWLQSAANTVGSGTSAAVFTTQNLTSGSKLIAWVSISSAALSDPVTSVHDSQSTPAQFVQLATNHLNGNLWADMWVLDTPAADAGTKPTISAVTSSGEVYGNTILVQEVSGLLTGTTTAILDGAYVSDSGTASPGTIGTYSSLTTSEYLTAVYMDPGDGFSVTNSSTYTADTANVNASSYATLFVDYKNSSGTGETASWTLSGAATWGSIVVAFKLGAAAGTAGPPLLQVPARPPAIVTGRRGLLGAARSR